MVKLPIITIVWGWPSSKLKDALKVGDEIHILGHITNFNERVESLEIEYRQVQAVELGAEVALKVVEKARRGDTVYIVKTLP